MSSEVFHRSHMTVTEFTGPARSDDGPRKRYQIYAHDGGDSRVISLSSEQWDTLRDYFRSPEGAPAEEAPSGQDRGRDRPARGSGTE